MLLKSNSLYLTLGIKYSLVFRMKDSAKFECFATLNRIMQSNGKCERSEQRKWLLSDCNQRENKWSKWRYEQSFSLWRNNPLCLRRLVAMNYNNKSQVTAKK